MRAHNTRRRAPTSALGAVLGLLLWTSCSAPALDWQGRPTTALDAYQRSFEVAVGDRYVATMPASELVERTRGIRVLWLGDHHRDGPLHEQHMSLLQRLRRAQVPLALGLEALAEQDSLALQDFLAHRTSLERFTDAVRARWPESWLDGGDVDCTHYRRLLLFAATSDTPAFPLEPAPRLPLAQRDDRIAANLRAAAARYPDRLIVVVVGQAHLLGLGNLIARVGLPSLALGAEPPPMLPLQSAPGDRADTLWQSSGGLWFFAGIGPRQP